MPSRAIIGRDSELGRVQAFLADSVKRALVIAGEPGVGKSTVLAAALHGIEDKLVLRARPAKSEAGMAFAALTDLLDGIEVRGRGLPEPQVNALEAALLRAEASVPPANERAVDAGLLNLLRSLAQDRPVVLAVDDVQWLDADSRSAIGYAVPRLPRSAVVLLAAMRTDTEAPLLDVLDHEVLLVGGLSIGALGRLISERLGIELSRSVLRRVADVSGGNPLFALELTRHAVQHSLLAPDAELPVPDSLVSLLDIRVTALPADQRRLLLATSLTGAVPVDAVNALGLGGALAPAVADGLVDVDARHVFPGHPLYAAAARQEATETEVRELHAELAGLVADPVQRAHHLAAATEATDAAQAGEIAEAAAVAARRGALHDAIVLCRHAIRLAPDDRPALAFQLADYLYASGEEGLDDVLEPLTTHAEGCVRAEAQLRLCDGEHITHVDQIDGHLDAAAADTPPYPHLHAWMLAMRVENTAVSRVARIDDSLGWAEEAVRLTPDAAPDLRHHALANLAWSRALAGQSVADLEEQAGTLGYRPDYFRSVERAAEVRLLWRGELDLAQDRLLDSLDVAMDRGQTWAEAHVRLHLVETLLRRGDLSSAASAIEKWVEATDQLLFVPPILARWRALLAADRGDPDGVADWSRQAIEGCAASGLLWDVLESRRAQGIAALFRRAAAAAAEPLGLVWDHTVREGIDDPGTFPVAGDLVEALVELGRLPDAESVTGRLRDLSCAQDHPWGLATTDRCDGLLAIAGGGDGLTLLERAAARYGELGLLFDEARTNLTAARAARRQRKRRVSVELLERAAAQFDAISATGWRDQAHAELDRTGPAKTSVLTHTERRVAELAAAGHSNKQIATALGMSMHTVETHLSRSYVKFGITSRNQLARVLT